MVAQKITVHGTNTASYQSAIEQWESDCQQSMYCQQLNNGNLMSGCHEHCKHSVVQGISLMQCGLQNDSRILISSRSYKSFAIRTDAIPSQKILEKNGSRILTKLLASPSTNQCMHLTKQITPSSLLGCSIISLLHHAKFTEEKLTVLNEHAECKATKEIILFISCLLS